MGLNACACACVQAFEIDRGQLGLRTEVHEADDAEVVMRASWAL